MGVGLKPLEFTDCLTDSPYFRENLHYHERELEKTSQQIKRLVKEVKDLLLAAKSKFYQDLSSFIQFVKEYKCNNTYLSSSFLIINLGSTVFFNDKIFNDNILLIFY